MCRWWASCRAAWSSARCQRGFAITSKEYLKSGERILVVDDFLACGNAALGLADLCGQAGASVLGFGFLVEKSFQRGRELILKALPDVRVESLASIASLDGERIRFG